MENLQVTMTKIFSIVYIYFCSLAIPLFVIKMRRKIYPQNAFLNAFSKRSYLRTFIRDLIFFIITVILFIYFFAIIVIPIKIKFMEDNSLIASGLFANIIIIFSGITIRFVYEVVRFLINKILRKNILTHIGENSRTWAFIMACLFYVSIGLSRIGEFDLEIVGFTALSIIFGRLFWIDFKINSIKNFYKSFYSLPYCMNIVYSIIISATIVSPFVTYAGVPLASIASTLGMLSALIISIYKCRFELLNFLLTKISEKS